MLRKGNRNTLCGFSDYTDLKPVVESTALQMTDTRKKKDVLLCFIILITSVEHLLSRFN